MHKDGAAWDAAMRRGDFAAAWAISDRILAGRDRADRDDPAQPYHLRWVWDGTALQGRDVLVRCYHGLGDTLQFARTLPALAAQARRVTLEAPPELCPLLAARHNQVRILPFRPEAPAPPLECDIEIMELAHALRLAPGAAPPAYLAADRAAPREAAIGLCWRAGGWDPDRSLPPTAIAAFLAAGGRVAALHTGPAPPGFCNPQGCPQDLVALAGFMAGLDLIVTVDTMIAHLAGALGLPTWLLLKHTADWRWGQPPGRSPWYPAMRLFRQEAPGDWGRVIEGACSALRQRRNATGY